MICMRAKARGQRLIEQLSKNSARTACLPILVALGAFIPASFCRGQCSVSSAVAKEVVVPAARCKRMPLWAYRIGLGAQLQRVTCDPNMASAYLIFEDGTSRSERDAHECYSAGLQRGRAAFRGELRPTTAPLSIVRDPTELPSTASDETTIFLVGERTCALCQSLAGGLSLLVAPQPVARDRIKIVYLEFDDLRPSNRNKALAALNAAQPGFLVSQPGAIVWKRGRFLDASGSAAYLDELTLPGARPAVPQLDAEIVAAELLGP